MVVVLYNIRVASASLAPIFILTPPPLPPPVPSMCRRAAIQKKIIASLLFANMPRSSLTHESRKKRNHSLVHFPSLFFTFFFSFYSFVPTTSASLVFHCCCCCPAFNALCTEVCLRSAIFCFFFVVFASPASLRHPSTHDK